MPAAPEISFALKSIAEVALDHQVEVNPLTGAATVRVPLPLTSGRSEFSPALALEYNSSAGNSVFGVGWSLSGLSMIGLSSKRLPKYEGDDQFVFNGSEELVPILTKQDENWEPRVDNPTDFWVHYYRSKVEQDYTRFEKWVHRESGRIHWRVKGPDNSVAVYGLHASGNTRIQDLDGPSRTYQWLIETRYDDNGNAVFYEYLPENTDNIDHSLELQRLISGKGFCQRYLKRIVYGNTCPLYADAPIPDENSWLFQVVFDYGDHGDDPHPCHESNQPWTARPDPFSTYRPGFEVRTRRLCRRVMMFHHFDQLGGNPAAVGAITLNYVQDPAGTTLQQIGYTGYRTDIESGEITRRATPALSFAYSQASMGRHFDPIPETAAHNLPQGLSGMNYRWIDLYGEGLPGILTETDQAWYYKSNLGRGQFGNQTLVARKPSNLVGSYALSDFDSDGNPDLVVFAGRQAGYCEYDRDAGQWQGYRPFASAPVLEEMGVSAQWIDLNGDGRSDIIISKQDRFTWYPSEGKKGFGQPVEFANPGSEIAAQPQALEEDLSLKYLFADMTGDGLPDRVHIQNGRVEYWPHLGNGRFGDAIVMENAPVFDFETQFDLSRLRLADLDDSGTADLLYIGRGEICYWINASGNRFVEGGMIAGLPYIDNLSSVQVLDFLGDGTPCLVWSSPLNGQAYSPIQYLRLTKGVQPRLLLSVDNTMGRVVELNYSTSGRHYLRDKAAGRPWISKLPNHSTVADRMEVVDQIGNARLCSRYEYHDGFFDSEKRVFRGFGQVDQYDSEVFDETSDIPEEAFTEPACSRTFFHNGAFGWDDRRTQYYYNGDPEHARLTEAVFQEQLDFYGKTFEDGFRTLAGQTLRQEIFAVSREGQRAEHPFQVTQNTYRIRQLQPARGDDDACYDFYLSEALVHEYEQDPHDPRVTHNLTLDVDGYGNATSGCAVAYPRRDAIADALDEQRRQYISVSTDEFINIDEPHRLETGIPIESKAYEMAWPQTESGSLLAYDTVRTGVTAALADVRQVHEPLPADTETHRARLIQWQRLFYWNDAHTTVLPPGDVGPKTLLHHQESACFTNDLVGTVFEDRVEAAMLESQGRYHFQNDYWWQPGPTLHYMSDEGFFDLDRIVRPDGGTTQYFPDRYHLTLESVTDAVGNRTRAVIDYNLIAPCQIVDPNENVTEVCYDPLGMIVVTTTQGNVAGPSGASALYGHDRLADYTRQPAADAEAILADPLRFIQNAGQFLYYDLEAVPLFSLSLVREQWVHDGTESPPGDSPLQIRLTYTDGFGRALQSKQKVEEGMAIQKDAGGHVMLDLQGRPLEAQTPERWRVSGHTVYNNKQLPVRQYEPFFSPLARFEDDPELRAFGVSTFSRYDALGRLTRTELPNGTLARVEMTPWEIRSFDPNDTVAESAYGVLRALLPAEDPQRQAYDRTLAHADTPLIVQRDPLGRDIRQIETSHDDLHRVTRTRFDIQGNTVEIIDPRGLSAFQYQHDMLGRVLHEHSMDAGEKWLFADAMDQPLHQWDGRGVHQHISHDALGRPIDVHVRGLGLDQRVEHRVYGDDPAGADGAQRNARGRLAAHYDQAGLYTVRQYAPDGPALQTERQLVLLTENYSAEPDWTDLDRVPLEPPMISRTAYDALGRVVEQALPDQTIRAFRYLPGGDVNRVLVSTADGELSESPFLQSCAYNAKGQRIQSLLGNDIEINYTYERETLRLQRLTAAETGGLGRTYQDIHYTYDPVGNITRHEDQAQASAAGSLPLPFGLGIAAHSDDTYDAFYQLRQATGRVHQALLQHDYRPGLAYRKIKGTQHLTPENPAAVERYTRTYSYDAAANVENITHRGATQNWSTGIRTSAISNRSLPARDHNGIDIPDPEAHYDANGNCTYLPHLRRLDWHYRNNIAAAVIIERPESLGGHDAEYYVYGGDGMRVRKIHRKRNHGAAEIVEKIYLEDCEIKRIHIDGRLILARTTAHISDGANRIALLHRWTADILGRETENIAQSKTRYQLSNHLGTSMLEVSEHGEVITYEEYFPFGGTAFMAGDQREVRLKAYRYSSKERDDATGFYYYGYRYYAAWIGNWLSPDPIGPEDSLNLYQFVRNNPVTFMDPYGLHCGRCIPPRRSYSRRGDQTVADVRRRHAERMQQMQALDLRLDRSAPPEEVQPPARSDAMAGTLGRESTVAQLHTAEAAGERSAPVRRPAAPPHRSGAAAGSLGRQRTVEALAQARRARQRARRERTEPVPQVEVPDRSAGMAGALGRETTAEALQAESADREQLDRGAPVQETPVPAGSSAMAGSLGREQTTTDLQQAEQERAQLDRTAPVDGADTHPDGEVATSDAASGSYQFFDPAPIPRSPGLDAENVLAAAALTLAVGAAIAGAVILIPEIALPLLLAGIAYSAGLRVNETIEAGQTDPLDIGAAIGIGVLDLTGIPFIIEGIEGESVLADRPLSMAEREARLGIGLGAVLLFVGTAGVARSIRTGGRSSVPRPTDPYDVRAWQRYYDANPGVRRSVGAAAADSPEVGGPGHPVRDTGSGLRRVVEANQAAMRRANREAFERLRTVRRTEGDDAARALQERYDSLGGPPQFNPHKQNIAAIEYFQMVNGELRRGIIVRISRGRHAHSEYQIATELDLMGIAPEQVTHLYTLYSPCSTCGPNLAARFQGLHITYSLRFTEKPGRSGIWGLSNHDWW